MDNPINNEIFDTRDLIEYLEHLEQEIVDNFNDFLESNELSESNELADDIEEVDLTLEAFEECFDDEICHYIEIRDFCREIEYYCDDYSYGATVIHEDYFVEYVEDFCKDCGYISDDLPACIGNNIDWDGVADDFKHDYTSITYECSEYYVR